MTGKLTKNHRALIKLQIEVREWRLSRAQPLPEDETARMRGEVAELRAELKALRDA